MMKPLLPLILLFSAIGLFTLGSCSGVRNDYSEYHRLPGCGWRYGDTLHFSPVHTDSLCKGFFVVAIRYDGDYPYRDLWLEVEVPATVTVADTIVGMSIRRDTVRMVLADRYGNYTGSGIGPTYQMADTLGVVSHRSGSPVKVRHIMRTDTLAGVNQVGLFFVPE